MNKQKQMKILMDREKLSSTPTCPACGKNFSLGEIVVPACGEWGTAPKLVHEEDAIFDESSGRFIERKCYEGNLR